MLKCSNSILPGKNRSHELILDKPADDDGKSKLGRYSRTKNNRIHSGKLDLSHPMKISY